MLKNPPATARDTGDASSIPGLGRSPGEGNGNPLQDSCLGNPMGRRGWQATFHGGHKQSDTTEHTHVHRVFLRDGGKEAFSSWFSGGSLSSHQQRVIFFHCFPSVLRSRSMHLSPISGFSTLCLAFNSSSSGITRGPRQCKLAPQPGSLFQVLCIHMPRILHV